MKTIPQSPPLFQTLWQVLQAMRPAFSQERIYLRVLGLVLAEILAVSHHKITDLLRVMGLANEDWTAWYRLLQQVARFDEEWVAIQMIAQYWSKQGASEWAVLGGDVTHIARDSHKMEGTAWAKCPRNPAFKIGIHRAQRMFNGCWFTPLTNGYSRALPLRFLPCFPEKAVRNQHAACKEHEASVMFLTWVREHLDALGGCCQRVLYLADGAYDQIEHWKGVPEQVFCLVRTASNRVLKHLPPTVHSGRGRKRLYGERTKSPGDWLSEELGWHKADVTVRGYTRNVTYRVEGPFLRETLPNIPLMLIVVRGQRWEKHGHHKRRKPCFYLIQAVQDATGEWHLPLPIETLLAWAWQRWELEVVHRESKSLLGTGDKQCWQSTAAVSSLQWSMWVYALVTWTGYLVHGLPHPPAQTAAWYPRPKRWTLTSVLNELRDELWQIPDFYPLLSRSAGNWGKIEAVLTRFRYAGGFFAP